MVTLPAALAAQKATKTIPIVFVLVPEPVRSNLVSSFAKPGGNITGLTQIAVELSTKRLELLKEAFPRKAGVALLVNANDQQTMHRVIDENKRAEGGLGLEVFPIEVRSLDDFERAEDRMVDTPCEGIVANPDGLTFQGRALLLSVKVRRRLWQPARRSRRGPGLWLPIPATGPLCLHKLHHSGEVEAAFGVRIGALNHDRSTFTAFGTRVASRQTGGDHGRRQKHAGESDRNGEGGHGDHRGRGKVDDVAGVSAPR